MKKSSSLAVGLKAAAWKPPAPTLIDGQKGKVSSKTVLIGGHFAPEVRRALLLAQAQPRNQGKNLKQMLGEAINDFLAKCGVPEAYSGEA